jgi:hypothetical protein
MLQNGVSFYGPSCDPHKSFDERNLPMSQFWKIDTTQWINPVHIAHIEDDPTRTPPRLVITMAGDMPALRGRGVEHYTMELYSPARERVLQYLAHNAAPDERQEPA